MAYIHELANWPSLTWRSDELAAPLAAVRHKQGRLLGKMDSLGFDVRNEANLVVLTSDVVKSSAIEGELLDSKEVRSSIARRMGLETAGLPQPSRDVEGVVEMMLDATQNYTQELRRTFCSAGTAPYSRPAEAACRGLRWERGGPRSRGRCRSSPER